MKVLFVDRDGYVRSGRLVESDTEAVGCPTLFIRGGKKLQPSDIVELLAPPNPDEDQEAALHRANQAGYSVGAI